MKIWHAKYKIQDKQIVCHNVFDGGEVYLFHYKYKVTIDLEPIDRIWANIWMRVMQDLLRPIQ